MDRRTGLVLKREVPKTEDSMDRSDAMDYLDPFRTEWESRVGRRHARRTFLENASQSTKIVGFECVARTRAYCTTGSTA